MKRIIIVILLLVTLPGCSNNFFFGNSLQSDSAIANREKIILDYLNDRYDDEFSRTDKAEIRHKGDYELNANVRDWSQTFYCENLGDVIAVRIKYEKGYYIESDNYIAMKYRLQEAGYLTDLISRVFDEYYFMTEDKNVDNTRFSLDGSLQLSPEVAADMSFEEYLAVEKDKFDMSTQIVVRENNIGHAESRFEQLEVLLNDTVLTYFEVLIYYIPDELYDAGFNYAAVDESGVRVSWLSQKCVRFRYDDGIVTVRWERG